MTSRLRWNSQGAAYTGLAALLLFAGAGLQAMTLVVLGTALGTLLIVDAVWASLRNPVVSLHVSPSRVDEESTVQVHVKGDRLRNDQTLRVRLPTSFELEKGTDLWTPNSDQETHTFSARAKVRGPQKVGPLEMRTWSPMRLWAREETVDDSRIVDVVPRRENVKDVLLASRTVRPVQGRFQVNRPGQGFEFFALRGYQSGDTIRSVNWKATARKDDLIVNQRVLETQTKLTILLDSRTHTGAGPAGRTPLDRGCRAALGLYADAVSNRDSIQFFAYGNGIIEPTDTKSDKVLMMASLLARLPATGETDLAECWKEARKGAQASAGPILVITSAEADPTLEDTVTDMLARGHPVTILSPTPTDDLLPEIRIERQRRRQATLDRLQNRGAVAVDWQEGTPLVAQRATIPGVKA